MKGFIKLHRQIIDWEWYQDSATKAVFIHILLNACYDSCRFMGADVTRGQYMTSLSRLSRDLNISVRQVRTALNRLEKTGEIDTQTSNKATLITISNYDSYQVEDTSKKRKSTSNRQANDTQATHINKKERKEEGKKNTNKDYFDTCSTEEIWISKVGMQYHISSSKVKAALAQFNNHLDITNDMKRSARDYKSHFVNWLKYNLESIETTSDDFYKWKWKGQAMKTGTKEEYKRDKALFDKEGFEFKTIQGWI